MYPQPWYREMGKGGIPSIGKIQKITPEWQTEQLRSVDSVVARVKGKHHDGDVSKLGGVLCRQIRWYRELFRPVWMKGLFILKGGESKAWIHFQKLAYLKMYHDLFAEQRYRKSKGFEVPPTFLISKQKRKNRTIIHTKEEKIQKKTQTKEKKTEYKRILYF